MRHILKFAAILSCAAPALANDSTASTGAGGLEIKRTDSIDMASEDLFVSVEQIRIAYQFRNPTKADVETIVAFPMPDRDLSQAIESDVAYPSDFKTVVDGQLVHATLERKVMANGREQSALLNQLQIPIAPDSIGDATKAMDALPAADKHRLVALGLARDDEWDDDGTGMKHHLVPLWTVKDIWWWTQRFPAGQTLSVNHSYIPGAGGSVGSMIPFAEYRNTPEVKAQIKRYCVDKTFLASVDRRTANDKVSGAEMPERRVDYILTTGANWRAPIGSFRLVVDKGKASNLVSFCETGVRQISPTQFEVRHTNWTPTSDLHVLIIEPPH